MKRIWKVIFSCALLLPTLQSLQAQDRKFSFLLYGNLLLPVGQFGEKIGPTAAIMRRAGFDYGEKVGLATTGIGVGAEVFTNVRGDNFAWVVSGKLLLTPTDNARITSFFRSKLGDSVHVAFVNGNWTNIPVLTGFKYVYNLGEQLGVYGMAQAGVNITQQASRKATVAGLVVEETNFKFMIDFGFELGLGIELMNRYNVGIRYLNLGSPRYEGTRKLNEAYFPTIPRREMSIDGDERPVSMFLITVGYEL